MSLAEIILLSRPAQRVARRRHRLLVASADRKTNRRQSAAARFPNHRRRRHRLLPLAARHTLRLHERVKFFRLTIIFDRRRARAPFSASTRTLARL